MTIHTLLLFETTKNSSTAFTQVEDTSSISRSVETLKRFQKKYPKRKRDMMQDPEITDASNYKLHITLSEKSHTKERVIAIKNILLNYLHVIPSFKYVNLELIQAEILPIDESLLKLNELEAECAVAKSKWYKVPYDPDCLLSIEQTNRIGKLCGKYQLHEYHEALPVIWSKQASLTKQRNDMASALKRFSKSDQFTIYIPRDVNKQELLRMCQEINTLLIGQEAEPGECTEAELKIGQYINFRQERLLDDYKLLGKKSENHNESTWISAEENSPRILSKLKPEMEKSDLYQYLSTHLNIKVAPNKWQILWNNTNGSEFDKACALLAHYACSYDKGVGDKKGDRFVAGKAGRFFSGRWNSHHGDPVQRALNICNHLQQSEQTSSNLFDALFKQIYPQGKKWEGNYYSHNKLNPQGALRQVLAPIRLNIETPKEPQPGIVALSS